MKEHCYELKYINGTRETIMKFEGDIAITELYDCLRDFLAGAGWDSCNIDKLFNIVSEE